MELPFTREAFAAVFIAYNRAIWPAQLVAWSLGAVAVSALVVQRAWSARVVFGILALVWAWTGIAYHAAYFADINRAAYVFGFGFLIEAVLLAHIAIQPRGIRFASRLDGQHVTAWALIVYGLAIYPLTALLWTHPYPATPMFGVTPCSTVIFTFGAFLLAKPYPDWWIFVVPSVWTIIGGSAAIILGVREDWMLFGALLSWLIIGQPWRGRRGMLRRPRTGLGL